MKSNLLKLILCFLFPFLVNEADSQAIVDGNDVYYPFSHTVDYDQKVYKTAVQIDELDFVVTENLALRVYYPTDIEPEDKRPLVVLVHGGGFIGGTFASFFDEAETLAQLGYVAVSVQYRLCKRADCVVAAAFSYPCNVSWANSLVPSSYVAAVDVQDAIEWLVLHAADYNIDKDRIAIGGHSAGGITSLNVAYMDQSEVNEICSGCGTWPDYLEESLEENAGIKAVFTMSGAIYDTLWIDSTEQDINLMAIHGTDDGVVFYGSEPVYPCCNTYAVPIHGACPMIQRHLGIGGNSYLFSGNDFGHNVFDGEWWPIVQDQILWFLGKSFFAETDDAEFQKHVEWIRSAPVVDCPAPLQPVIPSSLCGIELSELHQVSFEYIPTEDLSGQADIVVFPNPVDDYVSLTFVENLNIYSHEISINVYDAFGQLINFIKPENFSRNYQLNFSLVPQGVYFIRCQYKKGDQEKEIVKKIVVIR